MRTALRSLRDHTTLHPHAEGKVFEERQEELPAASASGSGGRRLHGVYHAPTGGDRSAVHTAGYRPAGRGQVCVGHRCRRGLIGSTALSRRRGDLLRGGMCDQAATGGEADTPAPPPLNGGGREARGAVSLAGCQAVREEGAREWRSR